MKEQEVGILREASLLKTELSQEKELKDDNRLLHLPAVPCVPNRGLGQTLVMLGNKSFGNN